VRGNPHPPKQKQKTGIYMTYSSSLAMGRQRFTQRGQNAISFRAGETRLGPVSNTVALVILTCLLALLYLTQVTKTNAFGYRINTLKTEAAKLQQEHDQLEVTSARLQALDRVKNSAVANKLVSVSPAATVQN
jgi:hypothetical protein